MEQLEGQKMEQPEEQQTEQLGKQQTDKPEGQQTKIKGRENQVSRRRGQRTTNAQGAEPPQGDEEDPTKNTKKEGRKKMEEEGVKETEGEESCRSKDTGVPARAKRRRTAAAEGEKEEQPGEHLGEQKTQQLEEQQTEQQMEKPEEQPEELQTKIKGRESQVSSRRRGRRVTKAQGAEPPQGDEEDPTKNIKREGRMEEESEKETEGEESCRSKDTGVMARAQRRRTVAVEGETEEQPEEHFGEQKTQQPEEQQMEKPEEQQKEQPEVQRTKIKGRESQVSSRRRGQRATTAQGAEPPQGDEEDPTKITKRKGRKKMEEEGVKETEGEESCRSKETGVMARAQRRRRMVASKGEKEEQPEECLGEQKTQQLEEQQTEQPEEQQMEKLEKQQMEQLEEQETKIKGLEGQVGSRRRGQRAAMSQSAEPLQVDEEDPTKNNKRKGRKRMEMEGENQTRGKESCRSEDTIETSKAQRRRKTAAADHEIEGQPEEQRIKQQKMQPEEQQAEHQKEQQIVQFEDQKPAVISDIDRRSASTAQRRRDRNQKPSAILEAINDGEGKEEATAKKRPRVRLSSAHRNKEAVEDAASASNPMDQNTVVEAPKSPALKGNAPQKRCSPDDSSSSPILSSPVAKKHRYSGGLRASSQVYKVLFTGLVDKAGEKVVQRLGGFIAKGVTDMTYLVTAKMRRTVKFLCAVARGTPIVDTLWLVKCGEANSFLPPENFILKDKELEEKFNFNLRESLQIASNQPLLQGYKIHVTKSVQPEPLQMKEIITCSGATFLARMPSAYKAQTVVVSCEEDWSLCVPAVAAQLPVVSAEFLLTGILQQKIDTSNHALSAPASKAPPTGAQGRGRKRT